MRSILASILLLVAILVLYEATIGSESGAGQTVQDRGSRMQNEIGALEP